MKLSISILEDPLRKEIMSTYMVVKSVNDSIRNYEIEEVEKRPHFVLSQAKSNLKIDTDIAKKAINNTLGLIRSHLLTS